MRAEAGHHEPFVIYRSVNRDGETYALEPRSLERLRAKLGGQVHARPRVFIAHEAKSDDSAMIGDISSQIILILSGIPEERLRELGGVIFQDPVTEQVVPRRQD
jgi:hypothetical protein